MRPSYAGCLVALLASVKVVQAIWSPSVKKNLIIDTDLFSDVE